MRAYPFVAALFGALVLACHASPDDAADSSPAKESEAAFSEYDGQSEAPDPTGTRLCLEAADPDGASDKIAIHCETEGQAFAEDAPVKADLVIASYNMERGYHVDEQAALFAAGQAAPLPDVLILNEADRGCSRSGHRAVAHDLAAALHMNYVFGVEFVELPREGGSGDTITEICEHGNAILSRYPIGNVRVIRQAAQKTWYGTEEPRLGGRMLLVADLKIGTRLQRVIAVHFESEAAETIRAAQAAEAASVGLASPYPTVIGGDMNSAFYGMDLSLGTAYDETMPAFLAHGYLDSHVSLDPAVRATRHGMILDHLVGRGVTFSSPGLGAAADWDGLSDHRPLWATVTP